VSDGLVLSLRFPARPDRLRGVRDALRERIRAEGCSEEATCDVVLAVDEACQNIIRHAYGHDPEGTIVLEVERRGQDLVFWLRDFAPEIDIDKVRPRELDDVRPGGLGTHFIRECMDRADFVPPPGGGGNLLRMTKRIDASRGEET
jgi:sigma-B regulation protein RsbU (phosphoserine phosphatase)